MTNDSKLRRRTLLRAAFYAATATAATPLLQACRGSSSVADACSSFPGNGELSLPTGRLAAIGELGLPDPLTQIATPEGFSVRAVATSGLPVATPGSLQPLSSYVWHNLPDGGACYSRNDGGWIYTSNSEIPGVPLGGCGAIAFNADGDVDDAYSILTGTTQNCAGGKTPWQTWVSCEETGDGQCWECDPYQPGQGVAKPALGRFAHEAIAVDPKNRVVYLTEDAGDGRFYRWVATGIDEQGGGRLALEHGTLEVMNLEGYEDNCYPADVEKLRELRGASWKPVIDADLPQGEVRAALQASGNRIPGTVFKGGEGLWYYELPASLREGNTPPGGNQPTAGLVFWTTKGDNRVWALDIENQLVELIFDNSQIDPDFGDVDNLTISPWGDILVAEDPPQSPSSRIMVVIPNEPAKVLVEVFHPGSEICGPAFSPDGSKLYFSSQRRGSGETYELTLPAELVG